LRHSVDIRHRGRHNDIQ